jgi:hypothetical protein
MGHPGVGWGGEVGTEICTPTHDDETVTNGAPGGAQRRGGAPVLANRLRVTGWSGRMR